MTKVKLALIVVVVLLFIGVFYCCATPSGRAACNNWRYDIQKADDATNYNTLKRVEDTCRAMISSYEADRLIYEQYKDSDDEFNCDYAEQAKMRANRTAASYNNYITENSYIWKNGLPNNIPFKLEYLD